MPLSKVRLLRGAFCYMYGLTLFSRMESVVRLILSAFARESVV